jgi:hypothetical protein
LSYADSSDFIASSASEDATARRIGAIGDRPAERRRFNIVLLATAEPRATDEEDDARANRARARGGAGATRDAAWMTDAMKTAAAMRREGGGRGMEATTGFMYFSDLVGFAR